MDLAYAAESVVQVSSGGHLTNKFEELLLMRINILLESAETGERIYLTSKNRRNTPDRLELKKYSPKLRRVTVFKEVK